MESGMKANRKTFASCCNCGERLPLRSFIISPQLSVADVRCPHCKTHLHASPKTKSVAWIGLVTGGLVAAASAYTTWHILGWSKTSSAGIMLIVAFVTGGLLTAYSCFQNDFYVNG